MHCPAYLHVWMQLTEPSKPTPTAAPPLLSVGPVNQENNKGKSIDSVATLSTVLVEPTYLQRISNATFADADMKKFVELAQSLSPRLSDCPPWWCPTGGPVPQFL